MQSLGKEQLKGLKTRGRDLGRKVKEVIRPELEARPGVKNTSPKEEREWFHGPGSQETKWERPETPVVHWTLFGSVTEDG